MHLGRRDAPPVQTCSSKQPQGQPLSISCTCRCALAAKAGACVLKSCGVPSKARLFHRLVYIHKGVV